MSARLSGNLGSGEEINGDVIALGPAFRDRFRELKTQMRCLVSSRAVYMKIYAIFRSKLLEIGLMVMRWSGLAVGEPKADMHRILEHVCPQIPADKPRYLMGVGIA